MGRHHDPGKKDKARNARLNKKREDIAVDRRPDIEAAGGQTVAGDRIFLDERQTRRPLNLPRFVARRLCAPPEDTIMDCGRNYNQHDHGRKRERARKADESRRQAYPAHTRPCELAKRPRTPPSI